MRGCLCGVRRSGSQRWIDPDRLWPLRWFGQSLDELLWMGGIGCLQDLLALLRELLLQTPVYSRWRHQTQTTMTMLVVVPVEEARRPAACLFQTCEAAGIVWPILQGLELRLLERVVIRGVRTRAALGHLQFLQQLGHRLHRHGCAPVGM